MGAIPIRPSSTCIKYNIVLDISCLEVKNSANWYTSHVKHIKHCIFEVASNDENDRPQLWRNLTELNSFWNSIVNLVINVDKKLLIVSKLWRYDLH